MSNPQPSLTPMADATERFIAATPIPDNPVHAAITRVLQSYTRETSQLMDAGIFTTDDAIMLGASLAKSIVSSAARTIAAALEAKDGPSVEVVEDGI